MYLYNRRKVNNCENTVANGYCTYYNLLWILKTKTADLLIIGIN